MTDQPDDGHLPELRSQEEADVRRLLAEARHDEPIPAEVAARLDTVLAGLGRDDPGAPGVAPVIDLAARRRRRNAAAVLAGAAAVIVAGFAVGQVIDVGSSDQGGDQAASSSDVGSDRGQSTGAAGGSSNAPSPGASSLDALPSAPGPGGQTLLTLSSDHLERDLTVQLDQLHAAGGTARSPSAESFEAISCPPPTPSSKFGLGELFPALFDGKPAVLALRPPVDGRRQADVLSCSGDTTLQSASIPAH